MVFAHAHTHTARARAHRHTRTHTNSVYRLGRRKFKDLYPVYSNTVEILRVFMVYVVFDSPNPNFLKILEKFENRYGALLENIVLQHPFVVLSPRLVCNDRKRILVKIRAYASRFSFRDFLPRNLGQSWPKFENSFGEKKKHEAHLTITFFYDIINT